MSKPASSTLRGVPPSFNLLRYFTWASLIVLLVASLGAGVAAAWLVHATFVEVERDEADSLAEAFVTLLDEEGFGEPHWLAAEAVPDDLRARLRLRLDNFGVQEFTLLTPEGRVLEDFGRNRGADRAVWDEGMRQALAGRVALRWERDRSWPLAPFDADPSGEVETFIPIRGAGNDVAAVARVRRNLSPVLAAAHAMAPRILIAAGLCGLAVFVALWLLVRRADGLLQRQRRLIESAVAQLDLHNRLLEEVGRRKDEFYSMCSNDLREPLLSLRKAHSALLGDAASPLSAPQRRLVAECQRHDEAVLDLIDNLLDLARLESGDEELDLQDLDVTAILGNVITAHRVLAQGLGVTVRLECPPAVPPARGDRRKVTRAFSTLLSNAILRGPKTSVLVAVDCPDGEVCVHFTDYGAPIEPKDRERVFDPEPNGGGGTRSLSIVRELLECQRGSVTVASAPRSPTTFSVALPRRAA